MESASAREKDGMNKEYDILVVEDEPVVLAAIKKIVEAEELRVDDSVDVESALEKMKNVSYSLVISDLMLPKISGNDLVLAIKIKHPNVPVIVITGYATLENALQSFKIGSFDFIAKPFDTEAFMGVVRRGINYGKKLQREGQDRRVCIPTSFPSNGDENPCDLYCLGQHAWIRLDEDGTGLIGVGETFPGLIEDLTRVEFVTDGDEIVQGKCCARFITAGGLVNMFWAPLSGSIITTNRNLEHDMRLIDSDPFGQGWLLQIIPSKLDEELRHLTCCSKRAQNP